MDPTAPSQPALNEAYNAPSNPTSKTPSETQHLPTSGPPTTTRHATDMPIPRTQTSGSASGTSSALGRGPNAPGPDKGEAVGPAADELDGEQMHMLGEGEVYQAQLEKGERGGFGEEESLTKDLGKKMEEHREEVGKERERVDGGVDVKGALGGKGGVVTA